MPAGPLGMGGYRDDGDLMLLGTWGLVRQVNLEHLQLVEFEPGYPARRGIFQAFLYGLQSVFALKEPYLGSRDLHDRLDQPFRIVTEPL